MAARWHRAVPPVGSLQSQGFPVAYSQQNQQPYHVSTPAFVQQTPAAAQQYAPAPPAPATATCDSRMRSVEELAPPFRAVFPFRFFNAIQNECWPAIYQHGSNVVVAAPTGGGGCCAGACQHRAHQGLVANCLGRHASKWYLCIRISSTAGKTVLLELAILRLLSRHLASGGAHFAHKPGHLKAIYLAPSRALVQVCQGCLPRKVLHNLWAALSCWTVQLRLGTSADLSAGTAPFQTVLLACCCIALQEKVRDWGERFATLGVVCRELTGVCGHCRESGSARPHPLALAACPPRFPATFVTFLPVT